MQINKELRKYIEDNIFPSYRKNDLGHNLDHIKYVINRSLRFANEVDDINYDMVYTIAAYHDIGHYIDAKNHEKVSAEMLLADENLKKFFTEEEIEIMSEAVYDHRASLEGDPRGIYGKIVSSADRNTLVDVPLKRTYAYRLEHNPDDTLDEIIEESRQHIISKFGKKGYATEKMYFEDLDYKKFLEEISSFAENKEEFKRRFMEVNGLNNKLKLTFDEIKRHNPNMSLDEVLYAVYNKVKAEYNRPFDVLRNMILEANGIDELEYYTKNVRQDLKDYIAEHIFPEYEKNEPAHGIGHIKYVIERSFELVDENDLDVNPNIVYTVASYHDIGHHIDSKTHEIISADMMFKDKNLKRFFSDEERQTIKEAIEDHRASAKDDPRSIYGRIVSSADRNNTVEACLRRTYTYGKKLDSNATDEELFLRAYDVLTKKFGENGYAKFYFKDSVYEKFLQDLRELLSNKDNYIETQRQYIKKLKKEKKL